jgi:hypothetical protein
MPALSLDLAHDAIREPGVALAVGAAIWRERCVVDDGEPTRLTLSRALYCVRRLVRD